MSLTILCNFVVWTKKTMNMNEVVFYHVLVLNVVMLSLLVHIMIFCHVGQSTRLVGICNCLRCVCVLIFLSWRTKCPHSFVLWDFTFASREIKSYLIPCLMVRKETWEKLMITSLKRILSCMISCCELGSWWWWYMNILAFLACIWLHIRVELVHDVYLYNETMRWGHMKIVHISLSLYCHLVEVRYLAILMSKMNLKQISKAVDFEIMEYNTQFLGIFTLFCLNSNWL